MSRTYQHADTETGDYIQLNLCDGWFRITYKGDEGFDCEDKFGFESTLNPYSDITDLKLPSEMEYAF